jgi:hypothetical protein
MHHAPCPKLCSTQSLLAILVSNNAQVRVSQHTRHARSVLHCSYVVDRTGQDGTGQDGTGRDETSGTDGINWERQWYDDVAFRLCLCAACLSYPTLSTVQLSTNRVMTRSCRARSKVLPTSPIGAQHLGSGGRIQNRGGQSEAAGKRGAWMLSGI